MMLAAKVVLLLVLLPICAFSPGFCIIRKLRWSPLEKLCASVGLSLVLLYVLSFGIYWMTPPGNPADLPWTIAARAVAVLCVVLGIAVFRDASRLVACRQVRNVLLGLLFLLLWTLAILCVIRHYSGGGWEGDWLEHFQRTLFFLHHFPEWTPIIGGYAFPARPPMMNLLAAFFLAQVGDGFELFQVVFAFLSLLVFLPCCLIMPALAKRSRRRILPLVALFALNPVLMQNVTYPWTKLFAAFYVVLALCLYLAAWRKDDRGRMLAAFLALAAAVLVHYSAGPYVLFVTIHYLAVLLRQRRNGWRELAAVATLSGMLLATWFAWSVLTYGTRITFGSNSTVKAAMEKQGASATQEAKKFAVNLIRSTVPHPLLWGVPRNAYPQPNAAGRLRDYMFLIYQTNAIFGMGLIGGPAVLFLLYRSFRRRAGEHRRPQRFFWLMLVPFCLVLGIAAHPIAEVFGIAHVTLQPLIVLGLSLLAGNLASMPRMAASVILLGCLIDFSLGVLLQTQLQSLENGRNQTVFAGLAMRNGRPTLGTPQEHSPSQPAWNNWFRKHQFAASNEWLRQLEPYAGAEVEALRSKLELDRRDDQLYWRGWYARNGGSLVFLGDRTADLPAGGPITAALLAAAVVLLGAAWRQLTPRPAAR